MISTNFDVSSQRQAFRSKDKPIIEDEIDRRERELEEARLKYSLMLNSLFSDQSTNQISKETGKISYIA